MGKYIEVTGRGAASAAPDRIDLAVSVSLVRDTVADALDAANTAVAAIGAAVRAAGLADADIRTTHSGVSDEYAGPDAVRSGYRSSHDLLLGIGDLAAVDTVLTAAVNAAGDDFRMNGLTWSIADPAPLLAAARAAAFADAEEKAGQIATLAGATLGRLERVVETEGWSGGFPRIALAKADAAGFAPEGGSSRIEISLTVRWRI